ncbi:MAG: helix-turn-helix domain-containing protein [Oscillospiraceae bacterium]|nr:helix-turn-helix domain-containing protein [Oscillospiraceae bacterium]
MKIKRGQILKNLRTAKGFNQTRLADLLNISLTAYQKYEHGTAEPNFDNLSKIADFYSVSTDYLLGRTTIKQMATEQPDPFANINVSELEKRIIQKYTELDEDARKLTIELFRQFSKIFNAEQEEQKLPELPTAQPIQQTAIQKQKEAGELDDAETKKNVD